MIPSRQVCTFVAAFSILAQSSTACRASNTGNDPETRYDTTFVSATGEALPATERTTAERVFTTAALDTNAEGFSTNQLPDADHFPTLFAQQPLLAQAPVMAPPAPIRTDLAQAPEATTPSVGLQGGVSITPQAAQEKIDDLTKQILLKIIELEKFNVHYTLEVAKQGRWKGWRYGGLQTMNAGCGLAGAIIGTAERGYNLRSPGKLNSKVQKQANTIPEIGAIIGAGAAGLEFMINEYHDLQAAHHGFAPGTAVRHVNAIKTDIDRLLAERASLETVEAQDGALSDQVSVDKCESRVLKDLRDEALQEFERYHIGARKLFAFQQMQYCFDMAKYTLNAVGYKQGYNSLSHHNRVFNLRAGICFDVAGGLMIFGPIISRVYAKGVGELHRHYLRPTTTGAEAATVDTLIADHAEMDKMCASMNIDNKAEHAVARSAIYGAHDKVFQDEIGASQNARAKSKLTATQNIAGGVIVGGAREASGILFTVCGGEHRFNTHSARSTHVTNSLLFASSVISIPASMYIILDNTRINVLGEIRRAKMQKAGMWPEQLAKKRLADLDAQEASLKAM